MSLKGKIEKGVRLDSLDFYRGLVMVLLMLESAWIYKSLSEVAAPGSIFHTIMLQFTHQPWQGLHIWDVVQPAFMFIAGTAMAFSLTKQTRQGRSWNEQASHAIRRSWWLFFWGVLNYAVRGNHLSFELWDVLTQLAFTMLLAFLIFRWKPAYQILFTIGLLLLTEGLYRFTNIPGFNQPFTDQHNFGNYIDLILMDKINRQGWVAINCIPTAAHTIWGAVAGKWLLRLPSDKKKIAYLVTFGLVLLIVGYSLDVTGITPIIKRIATSSFTLVTGGWCLLALALLYFWIDMKQHKKGLKFFTIVGMNSIFIYLFFEIVVHRWLREYSNTIVYNILGYMNLNHAMISIVAALVLFFLQWYLCYWLYKKKIFFKV